MKSKNKTTGFREYIEKKGWTREQVRDLVCGTGHQVSVPRIQQVVSGSRPSLELAEAIERATGFPAKKLFKAL